jgi:hypothetical protein
MHNITSQVVTLRDTSFNFEINENDSVHSTLPPPSRRVFMNCSSDIVWTVWTPFYNNATSPRQRKTDQYSLQ